MGNFSSLLLYDSLFTGPEVETRTPMEPGGEAIILPYTAAVCLIYPLNYLIYLHSENRRCIRLS